MNRTKLEVFYDEVKIMYVQEGIIVPIDFTERFYNLINMGYSTSREIFLTLACNDLMRDNQKELFSKLFDESVILRGKNEEQITYNSRN